MRPTPGAFLLRPSSLVVFAALLAAARCASAPAVKGPPPVPIERTMPAVLQLEDQRILRVPPPPPAPAPVERRRGRAKRAPVVTDLPDLTKFLTDAEPRMRRRAALAIGRVGLSEGVPPLVATLKDVDADVRHMAAFALGLIGDPSSVGPLTTLLTDPSPAVRGSAAEALGLIAVKDDAGLAASKTAAQAVGQMAAEYARTTQVTSMQPDDESWPAAPEAEAFKRGLFALVRMQAYEPLASAVLDASGQPIVSWWPVAYALQRVDDKRAVPALRQLLNAQGRYTAAFAARGLGQHKDAASVEPLLKVIEGKPPAEVVVAAVRALAAIEDRRAAVPLAQLAADPATVPNVRLEIVNALGALHDVSTLAAVQDLLTDDWFALRSAALRAAAAIDQDNFVLVLSGLDPDRDWRVRAATAEILGTLPPEISAHQLQSMLKDEDKRVLPSVLAALVRLKVPDAAQHVLAALKEPDFVVRASAARLAGDLKPAGGAEALREAYKRAEADSAYSARAAAIAALTEYGPAEATETVKAALADKDWAVRVRAAELLAKLEPGTDSRHAVRPAPGSPPAPYTDPELIAPTYSPHVFLETPRGTIEFELSVLDAPQTSRNFMTLARKGYFNGLPVHRVVPNFVVQDGDSRGDGEGGPGYTIRDELNDRPYLRGTVGMALEWRDTGGSQFFITHSPQPHLDARYTVFGRVVNGMDVVDRIQQGDVIERVRVWDGKSMQ